MVEVYESKTQNKLFFFIYLFFYEKKSRKYDLRLGRMKSGAGEIRLSLQKLGHFQLRLFLFINNVFIVSAMHNIK